MNGKEETIFWGSGMWSMLRDSSKFDLKSSVLSTSIKSYGQVPQTGRPSIQLLASVSKKDGSEGM